MFFFFIQSEMTRAVTNKASGPSGIPGLRLTRDKRKLVVDTTAACRYDRGEVSRQKRPGCDRRLQSGGAQIIRLCNPTSQSDSWPRYYFVTNRTGLDQNWRMGWMDQTPKTVSTTRAPAVLIIRQDQVIATRTLFFLNSNHSDNIQFWCWAPMKYDPIKGRPHRHVKRHSRVRSLIITQGRQKGTLPNDWDDEKRCEFF